MNDDIGTGYESDSESEPDEQSGLDGASFSEDMLDDFLDEEAAKKKLEGVKPTEKEQGHVEAANDETELRLETKNEGIDHSNDKEEQHLKSESEYEQDLGGLQNAPHQGSPNSEHPPLKGPRILISSVEVWRGDPPWSYRLPPTKPTSPLRLS